MPIGVAGAVSLGAAALGAGASLYASNQQAGATRRAADQANATQQQALAQSRGDQVPYTGAGASAIHDQQDLLGLNGTDASTAAMAKFTASPGYAYMLDQGLQTVDHGAAAAGMLRSGNTLRAEQGLGNDLANQDFTAYYNRLAGISSLGENATAGVGNQGVTTAAGQASTDTSAGNQYTSIYGNTAKDIGAFANNAANNYLSNVGQNTLPPGYVAPKLTGYVPPTLTDTPAATPMSGYGTY